MLITFEQVQGILRHLLTTGGGILASKGLIEATQVETVVGAVLILIGTVWSYLAKK